MKNLPVLLFVLGFAFPLGITTACSSPRVAEVRLTTVALAITGMTCAINCPPKVQAALESVAGVEAATVDYDTRSASVRLREGTDTQALVAAVRKQGFGAAPK